MFRLSAESVHLDLTKYRRRRFGDGFEAQPVNVFDDEAARGVIRANVGLLFDKPDGTPADPDKFLRWANKFLDRNVKDPGRLTIQANAQKDPRKPGYARVPSGERTCPFCLMLAGCGYIYASEDTAGAGHDFHDDCDCEIVPEWDKGSNHIEGYDPDAYERMYRQARDALENRHANPHLRAGRPQQPQQSRGDHAPPAPRILQEGGWQHPLTFPFTASIPGPGDGAFSMPRTG